MTFLDVLARNLATRADHPFIVHAGRRLTYGQFDKLTNRAAHALRALGVAPWDRVTLALGNSLDWVAAAFGALKSGAIVHPLNPNLGPGELRYVLGHAEPRVLVHSLAGCAVYGALVVKVFAVRSHASPGWFLPVAGGLLFSAFVVVVLTSTVWYVGDAGWPSR